MRWLITWPHTLNLSARHAFSCVSSNMLTLSHMHQDSEKLYAQILHFRVGTCVPCASSAGVVLWSLILFRGKEALILSPLDTYPVVPALPLLPQRWFSQGQPRTSHPGRRCLPGPCRSVHPTPLEPYRSQSHRWTRSAAWLDHRPPHLHSSYSDQSLQPTGWTERL